MVVMTVHVQNDEFGQLVAKSVAEIPARFKDHLANVAFLVADVPAPHQEAQAAELHGQEVLLGLYEGIPLPARDGGYSGVLPDTITIFKVAHEQVARSPAELAKLVHETVWHEVAHYFGLDHGQIHELERTS